MPTPRMYQPIWDGIKSRPHDEPTVIRVHKSAAKTLIQGVRKEKSWENGVRRKIGEVSDGKLIVVVKADPHDSNFVIIKFTLAWSHRDL